MKQKHFFILTTLLIFAAVSAGAYWRQLHFYQVQSNVGYNVVGDSNTLYIGYSISGQPGIFKSEDMGKSWEKIYQEPFDVPAPFRDYWGMEYPAPGHMYFLYGMRQINMDTAVCIKRFDERLGQVVDSIVIDTVSGFVREDDFSMFDSLNGILVCGYGLHITRDGWKSYYLHNRFEKGYNEDSTRWLSDFKYVMNQVDMLSKDTIFFHGYNFDLALQDRDKEVYSFHYMVLDPGDTTYTVTKLTDGQQIKLGPDSIRRVKGNPDLLHAALYDYCYINDSTWIYAARGKDTGSGQCRTLEIYKTTNAGKFFYQVCNMDINAYGLSKIDFLNENFGVAAGNSCIVVTKDGGETWMVDTSMYKYNWEDYKDPVWGVHISIVDEMIFLGSWNAGVFKYEEEFGVGVKEDQMKPKECLIYPNPSTPGEILNFKLSKFFSGKAFVYDIYGKKVQQVGFFGNSFRLTEDIAPGTYLVCLMSGGKVVAREKINVK